MNEGGSCVLVGRHERTLIEAARRLQEPTDTIHHHDVQKPVVDYLVGNVASRTFWEGLNRDVVSYPNAFLFTIASKADDGGSSGLL